MNYLASFFTTPVDHTRYLDFSDLDALRPVSTDTKDAVEKDHLWGSFARSVGCDFLHSRDDVKWYLADLKKGIKRAGSADYFPINRTREMQSRKYTYSGSKVARANMKKYKSIAIAPNVDDFWQLQRARENVDIMDLSRDLLKKLPKNWKTGDLLERFNDEFTKILNEQSSLPGAPETPPELNLSWRELSYLPSILSRIPSLEHLNLADNEFRKVPEGIEKFQSLRRLNLSGNQIERVSSELSRIPSLKHLNLAENEFMKVPEGIEKFQSLRSLNLSNNFIERVPSELGKLTNLQTLDLRNNSIRQVPFEVESMRNCEILTDGNPLAEKRSAEEPENPAKRLKLEEA